jgi:lipoyl(octanoyl) transferase
MLISPLPYPGRGNSKSPVPKQAESTPGMALLQVAQPPLEWRISGDLVDYPTALAEMEARAAAIHAGTAPEQVWLLEHPALYTAGTSARPEDLLRPDALPVYRAGRGGQLTYHGPGQRIGYVMLDLKARGGDLRRYVHDLEEWIIRTLARFGVTGERRDGRIGIWVAHDGREDKIAALGVRVRHGVTFHGIAINRDPNLAHFDGIVPCGIKESADQPFGVTSLAKLGKSVTQAELDAAMRATFGEVFG